MGWSTPSPFALLAAVLLVLCSWQCVEAVPLVRIADGRTVFAFRQGHGGGGGAPTDHGHVSAASDDVVARGRDAPFVHGFLAPRTGPLGV